MFFRGPSIPDGSERRRGGPGRSGRRAVGAWFRRGTPRDRFRHQENQFANQQPVAKGRSVNTGDLTTLADVKAWLQTGQSAFPPTDDGLLARLITAASQYIQTWLNRQIAATDYLELRDGTGGQRLQ